MILGIIYKVVVAIFSMTDRVSVLLYPAISLFTEEFNGSSMIDLFFTPFDEIPLFVAGILVFVVFGLLLIQMLLI